MGDLGGSSMGAIRKAHAVWEHDLLHGQGKVRGTSGGLPETAVSWSARTEASGGRTSPEELLAAANAACYSMALSGALGRMQHPPERLEVQATCTFDKVGDAWTVTTMDLEVSGKVPGLDAAKFTEAATAASSNCPISRAIKGNVQVRLVSAKLL
jgi:osmotically inducible protein OsmC